MTEDDIPVMFGRHARTLARAYLYRLNKLRYRLLAEDLSQVALLAGVLAFRSFQNGHGATVSTWIKTKMRYSVIEEIENEFRRGQNNTAPTFSVEDLDVKGQVRSHAAPSEWQRIEAEMDTRAAMKCLDELESQVIIRRYFRNQTVRETGNAVGHHFTRVSQIDKAACLKMRSAFSPPFFGEPTTFNPVAETGSDQVEAYF